ncbi:hypothetical protein DPX16_1500 [Anabarilius grahami]|uniref:Uncharacterized protein n=1 Tax=Anabarilius grahami TaxID=495550 RepID=A0A3N0Z021_ANAGA|nr:hypothetical protein DPX16_1500 [Anabarilius grahami]
MEARSPKTSGRDVHEGAMDNAGTIERQSKLFVLVFYGQTSQHASLVETTNDRLRGLDKNIFAFRRHILLKAREAYPPDWMILMKEWLSAFAGGRGNKKDACLTQSPPPARPESPKICLRHASVIPRGQTPDLIPSRKGPGENGAFSLKSPRNLHVPLPREQNAHDKAENAHLACQIAQTRETHFLKCLSEEESIVTITYTHFKQRVT